MNCAASSWLRRRALEALERRVLGPKSEKMPPPGSELRRSESNEDAEARRLAGLERRRQRAALKQKLRQQIVIPHRVCDEEKQCPEVRQDGRCAARRRQAHYGSTNTCRAISCGKSTCRRSWRAAAASTSRPPSRRRARWTRANTDPGFIAHLIVMKCADSIPLHRLGRSSISDWGIPMARSTLTDLFHHAGEKLEPLWEAPRRDHRRERDRPGRRDVDEDAATEPARLCLDLPLSEDLIAYRFADNRSGDTPLAILGGHAGHARDRRLHRI